MIIPKALKRGDKVALISTARKIELKDIAIAKKQFADWGLEAIEGESLRKSDNQFCGNDKERAADLQWALNDPEISAVICFRGGYGTVRILDLVDFSVFQLNPKWVCGYSDVTALHNKISQFDIASLHSTMPVNFSNNTSESLLSFKNALFGEAYNIETPKNASNRIGNAKGELIGGNLSMLYSLAGTKFDIDTTDKILVLEDLDEYLYHIDRMLQNLKHAGKLSNLKALIVGGMTDMHDNDIPFGKNAIEIILDAVSEYNYPVCFDFPFGHLDDNRTIIFGKEAILDVGFSVQLQF